MPVINNKILKLWFSRLNKDVDFFSGYESSSVKTLMNLPLLVGYLYQAFAEKAKIVAASDFDTDGIMSGVIGYAGLTELGFNTGLHIPKPANGYGLHISDIDEIRAAHPDVKIILTADVGISDNTAIDYAHSLGIRVYVTDHHKSQTVCRADVAVNPNQLGESYDQPGICGAYVLYKVLESYALLHADVSKQLYIYTLRLFAGIATVADVMPLTGENRQLVRDAVSLMQAVYTSPRQQPVTLAQNIQAGIGLILDHFKSLRKITTVESINEEFLGFYLVPTLNSVKRMSGDLRSVYDIFFPIPNLANNLRVSNALEYLTKLNEQRKAEATTWFEALPDTDETRKYNVFITQAPAGLLGLLAVRAMQISGKPTLCLNYDAATDSYHGSGRSPEWFDFPAEVAKAGLSLKAAGHAGAFGITCPSSQALREYHAFYDATVDKAYFKHASAYVPREITINFTGCNSACDFNFNPELLKDYLTEYESFRPWGSGFHAPVFELFLSAGYKARVFGDKQQHAKFMTDDGPEVLLFNKAQTFSKLFDENGYVSGPLCVTGHFTLNSWNGVENINFIADGIDKITAGKE
jgi:single-stranded-DNA-specific exonuclease